MPGRASWSLRHRHRADRRRFRPARVLLGLAVTTLPLISLHADGGPVPAPFVGEAVRAAAPEGLRTSARPPVDVSGDRLTAHAQAIAAGEREEALALAYAALQAAHAAGRMAAEEAPSETLASLDEAVAVVVGPDAGAIGALPVPTLPRVPSTIEDDLAASAELAEAAAEVFQVSEQVRAAVEGTGSLSTPWAAAPSLSDLEARAAGAARAARAVRARELEPVVIVVGENGRLDRASLCALSFAPDSLLRCDAAAALELLNVAYRADFGRDLEVTSAYRDVHEQAAVRQARGWLAAPPGQSSHGYGIAVDLGGMGTLGDFSAPGYLWMRANAGAFGWHHPRAMQPGGGGPPEPWHWEFAG